MTARSGTMLTVVSRRRQRTAGRLAKRLPGYRYARRTLLPRLRENSTVRGLAKRVFELDAGDGRLVDVAPGTLLGGVGVERLPVVAVIALGLRGDDLDDAVDEVARLQVLTAGFRPVFVLTEPDFGAARRFGYVVELLIGEDHWAPADGRWADYRDQRISTVVNRYRTAATVVLGSHGLDDSARMVLAALRPAA